jgi:hypothetical protein
MYVYMHRIPWSGTPRVQLHHHLACMGQSRRAALSTKPAMGQLPGPACSRLPAILHPPQHTCALVRRRRDQQS